MLGNRDMQHFSCEVIGKLNLFEIRTGALWYWMVGTQYNWLVCCVVKYWDKRLGILPRFL